MFAGELTKLRQTKYQRPVLLSMSGTGSGQGVHMLYRRVGRKLRLPGSHSINA